MMPLLLAMIAGAAACSDSTGPESFSIAGTWTSAGFAVSDFSFTVVETARAVEGAGHRITGGTATAFRVAGANAGQRASLLFDFDDEPDVNFEGEFSEGDDDARLLQGRLFGGGYAGAEIVFQRGE